MTTESQPDKVKMTNEVSLKEFFFKIGDWWRFLLSKFVVIFGFGLLGGAAGILYAYLQKPTYTATTTLVLEEEKSSGGLGSLSGLASMAGFDLGGGGGIFQGDNILGLYRSRTMIEKTLLSYVEIEDKKQLLIDRYIEFNHLREKKWAKRPDLMNLRFDLDSTNAKDMLHKSDRLRDSILGSIVEDLNRENLRVTKPDKKLSTLEVNVISNDEIFSKAFNDALVRNVNVFYINTKTKKTLQNVKILQRKTDSVRAVMNGDIYAAVAVSDATPNLNPTRQVQRIVPTQRAQFSAETNKSVLGEMIKNLEMAKMSLLKETPLIQVIDSPIYPLKKSSVSFLKGMLTGGILMVLLVIVCLVLKRIYKKTMC